MKVIIVGSGIGGLTLAIALNKLGINAELYERAPALREVGAGIGLAGNALRVLDELGLGTAVRARSFEGAQGGLRNYRGDLLFKIPADQFTRQLGAVAVLHRAELLALLLQQVDPGRIHLGKEFVGFEQNHHGVTARFANGEIHRGDLLIGADGVKSAVRTQLLGHLPLRYSGYTAWRAVVESDLCRTPHIVETWGPGRRFGIVPMSGGRVYWFATSNTPAGQIDPPGRSTQSLLQLFRGWGEPVESLIAAAKEGSVLRNDICDLDPLRVWVGNRVALLGDAAHPMTPNLGQGACQAIEDAAVLAACLRSGEHMESALLEYQRRRVPRASQFVLRSRSLGALGQLSNPVLCRLRDAAVRLTPKWLAARQLESQLGFETLTPAENALFRSSSNRPPDGPPADEECRQQ